MDLELLPVNHPVFSWLTPDGVPITEEEAACWTPLPPVSSEDGWS